MFHFPWLPTRWTSCVDLCFQSRSTPVIRTDFNTHVDSKMFEYPTRFYTCDISRVYPGTGTAGRSELIAPHRLDPRSVLTTDILMQITVRRIRHIVATSSVYSHSAPAKTVNSAAVCEVINTSRCAKCSGVILKGMQSFSISDASMCAVCGHAETDCW